MPVPAEPRERVEEFSEQAALKDVFFEPGHAEIGPIGTRIMQENARWLIENPGYLVLIEGHTDYKGSRGGNFAVGERRARAARNLLIKEGVPETRIRVVSGAERPTCFEKTEACAARSRRVHFLVKPQ